MEKLSETYHDLLDDFHIDVVFVEYVEEYGLRHIVPIIALLFYFFVIFSLPSLVVTIFPSKGDKKAKAGKLLRMICFVWNVFLSVFSIICLVAIIPSIYGVYAEHGLIELLCDENGKHLVAKKGPMHFYYAMFLLSKFVELGDTFFLILKKPTRRPSFLHVYHHITVMVSCWYLAVTHISVAHYGIPMNLFIHSIMYSYYALYEIGYPQSWGILLTVLQMLQMVLGIVAFIIWTYLRYYKGINCSGKKYVKTVMVVGFIMYATYLVLFFRFFMGRYFGKKERSPKKKKEEKKDEYVKLE